MMIPGKGAAGRLQVNERSGKMGLKIPSRTGAEEKGVAATDTVVHLG
jgi:hypothetical protein